MTLVFAFATIRDRGAGLCGLSYCIDGVDSDGSVICLAFGRIPKLGWHQAYWRPLARDAVITMSESQDSPGPAVRIVKVLAIILAVIAGKSELTSEHSRYLFLLHVLKPIFLEFKEAMEVMIGANAILIDEAKSHLLSEWNA